MLANAAIVEAVAGALAAAARLAARRRSGDGGDQRRRAAAARCGRRGQARSSSRSPRLITPNLPEAARLLGTEQARSEAEAVAPGARRCWRSAAARCSQGRARQRRDGGRYPVRRRAASSGSRGRASTRRTRTAPAARCRRPSPRCWRRARPSGGGRRAKAFVWQALQAGRTLGVGRGSGPSITYSPSGGRRLRSIGRTARSVCRIVAVVPQFRSAWVTLLRSPIRSERNILIGLSNSA